MRDPELVQRAERAAAALEKAWIHWRVRHGLGAGQLPPVSSYVGYSLTEPWGQPRVVFGIDADEAERLAAVLEGHDCVGPVHAEVSSRPERWQQAVAKATTAPELGGHSDGTHSARLLTEPVPAQPAGGQDAVQPPQARFPEDPAAPDAVMPRFPAEPVAPGGPVPSAQPQFAAEPVAPGGQVPSGQPQFAAEPVALGGPAQAPLPQEPAAPSAPQAPAASQGLGDPAAEDLTAEQPILPRALRQVTVTADPPTVLPADALAYLQDLAARSAAPQALPQQFPAAPVLPPARGGMPGSGEADQGDMAAVTVAPVPEEAQEPAPPMLAGYPGIVALRPRSVPQPEQPELSHVPAERQWRPDPADEAQQPAADDTAAAQAQDQVARARLMPVSKLNQTRRPAGPSPEVESWPPGDASQRSTDTAV